MRASPTVRRFVTHAMASFASRDERVEWRAWTETGSREIPPDLACAATRALSALGRSLEDRIADAALDPEEAAMLENDLGYIADLEASFSGMIDRPVHA